MEETTNNTQSWMTRITRWLHDTIFIAGILFFAILSTVFWGGDVSWSPPWSTAAKLAQERADLNASMSRSEQLESQLRVEKLKRQR